MSLHGRRGARKNHVDSCEAEPPPAASLVTVLEQGDVKERLEQRHWRRRGALARQEPALFSSPSPGARVAPSPVPGGFNPAACPGFWPWGTYLGGWEGSEWDEKALPDFMSFLLAGSVRNNTFSYLKGSLSFMGNCTETPPLLGFSLTSTVAETCNLMTDLIIQDTILICVEKSY